MKDIIGNCLSKGTFLHGKTYDYEIKRVLGQGSFGITYLAAIKVRGDLGVINATVAIKEFFMQEVNGRNGTSVTSGSKTGIYDKYKQKFIKEAQHLGSLKYEYIVNVIESFEQNNTVYYSMEYVDGGNLDDYIKQKGHLSESEALTFTIQIASAMLFMHSKNMLHLDLKPSNIMIRREGKKIVLIDFGLSKQYDDNGNPESSTTIGAGTPGYAPLEQANYNGEDKGKLPVTMDVYALGGTMFKMLTGKKPPVASDILNDGFPEDELRINGLSSNVINLVSDAMSPLRKNRIVNMQSFLEILREIESQESDRVEFSVETDEETIYDSTDNSCNDAKSNFEQYVEKKSPNKFNGTKETVSSVGAGKEGTCDITDHSHNDVRSNFGQYVEKRSSNKFIGSEEAVSSVEVNKNNTGCSSDYSHGDVKRRKSNKDNKTVSQVNNRHSQKKNSSWGFLHWGWLCLKYSFYFVVASLLLLGSGIFDKCSNDEDAIEYFTDLSKISIGDYLYADGTYTHVLDSTNMDNCSGCVYNLETTEKEKEEGWKIGHVVALKDATDRNGSELFEWGPENTSIPNHVNYEDAIKEKDGYWTCLMDSACLSPAISSLYDLDGVVFNVPLPDGSKWYVPTVSDWQDIICNLGKVTIKEESSSLFSYDNNMASKEIYHKIKAFPHNMEKSRLKEVYSYWTCIQQGGDYLPSVDMVRPRAWAIYAEGEYGYIGNSPTLDKMKVRPVAAF